MIRGRPDAPRERFSVLIVDDDDAVRLVLAGLLDQAGIVTAEASSAMEAEALLERKPFDVVITDVRMPGINGLELLRRIRQRWPDVAVVMLTAHGTIQLAVEAIKAGAQEFMVKPFDREEVLFVVRKAAEQSLRQSAPPPEPGEASFVGRSRLMRELSEQIARAAAGSATVLIHGETGTGKELVARAIHQKSARAEKPFIRLNCAAVPDSLLESELFGYERGAFTGAANRKPGRVELAQGGSLFLDEIGDVPLLTQVKLLRILQERELERLGGVETIKVDVRFVSATHRDLEAMVQARQFRQDLFFRLNVIPLRVPPLRDRPEDIPELAMQFARSASAANGRVCIELASDAIELLREQDWPGNVRELEHFMERLVVFCEGRVVERGDILREQERCRGYRKPVSESEAIRTNGFARLDEQVRGAERDAIVEALKSARNNRSLAARLLGVSRRTLYNKLEDLGVTEAELTARTSVRVP